MHPVAIVSAVVTFLLSVGCFVLSYFQGKEIGPILNNAYLYASKEEQAAMDKKPHYKLSRDIFMGVGILFLSITLQTVLGWNWLFYVNIALALFIMIYAIAKSVVQSKKGK